jgi:hypothetical protein
MTNDHLADYLFYCTGQYTKRHESFSFLTSPSLNTSWRLREDDDKDLKFNDEISRRWEQCKRKMTWKRTIKCPTSVWNPLRKSWRLPVRGKVTPTQSVRMIIASEEYLSFRQMYCRNACEELWRSDTVRAVMMTENVSFVVCSVWWFSPLHSEMIVTFTLVLFHDYSHDFVTSMSSTIQLRESLLSSSSFWHFVLLFCIVSR